MGTQTIVQKINEAILQCGRLALGYYSMPLRVSVKEDMTVVSEADNEIEGIIEEALNDLLPDSYFIGEESADSLSLADKIAKAKEAFGKKYLWAVDPIDGTLNFVSHYGEWGISIGLMKKEDGRHVPWLGAVYLPIRDVLYYTDGEKSYIVSGASGKNPVKRELLPILYQGDDDLKQRIFTLNESKVGVYKFKDMKNIRVPGSTVVQLVSAVSGEAIGTITTGHIWDIAASLAIGKPIGVNIYGLITGEELNGFSFDNFVFGDVANDWKLKADYLVSISSAKQFLLKSIQL